MIRFPCCPNELRSLGVHQLVLNVRQQFEIGSLRIVLVELFITDMNAEPRC